MIVSSQEWSEGPNIDWRQITSFWLLLFVRLQLSLFQGLDVIESLQKRTNPAGPLDAHLAWCTQLFVF